MPQNDGTIKFQRKELKGSRLRCLMLTSQPKEQIADFLNGLIGPYATVLPKDKWMPRGFLRPEEAKLGKIPGFLSDEQRETIMGWWLKVRRNANIPNWDFVSVCHFRESNKRGLILVEAKAHEDELNVATDNCGAKNPNRKQIESVIKEANDALNRAVSGWALSPKGCYQLSNRFAWAWKVASLGMPVILVYLGFLNATDMKNGNRTILTSARQWHKCVLFRSNGIIPREVWNKTIRINNIPLVPLIRTADVNTSVLFQNSEILT